MSCFEALQSPPPAMPHKKTVFVVAAALINQAGEVFVAQRPQHKSMGGLWEFPGGKVKDGETPEYALMRELREELGIETRPTCMSPVGFASHTYDDFHLVMPLFALRVWEGDIILKEHQASAWHKVQDLYALPMPEADKPLLHQLEAML